MKILYISSGKIPSDAANSVHVMKMAQAFADHNNEVTLAYADGDSNRASNHSLYVRYAVRPNFKLMPVRICLPHFKRLFYALRVALEVLRKRYDFIYSRCIPSAFFITLLGRGVMFEVHDSPYSLSPFARWMFMRLLRSENCTGLVAISDALNKNLVGLDLCSPDKIITLHDGADLLSTTDSAKLELSTHGFHVGYTGHLYKGRGVDVILALASAFQNIGFHIVGGAVDDIEYWRSLCKSNNVHFYGHVPHKDVALYINAFDVLLAPYQRRVSVHGNAGDTAAWMSPLKVFEYMASGKPIICSDIPVLREVLEDGRNCLLCGPEDIDCWQSALLSLKADQMERARLGQAAKQEFEKKYTWFARAGEILTYIRNYT